MSTASVALPLSCTCGRLRGVFSAASTKGARGVCYCDDCQAYARWLDRDDLVDAHGGTEMIQTWPSRLRIDEGAGELSLLRLSPMGLHRWYAGCCRTPVGNTFGRERTPFVGLMRRLVAADDEALDGLYGRAHGVQGRFAKGGCPPGALPSASIGVIVGAMGILARGLAAGGGSPTPFFDAKGRPVAQARVLDRGERALLG